ncbi:LCP family protein [Paenibacillus harenae]|uniref:LCP family protein n=1 Tax=Paenibacillus harenae TaxID=306543 RepID=UPI002790BF3B|nr:LCP family protein [Paenibacillus harenae]MDQ0061555.1 LCP family protein required for cell wall assembly [Paenibacillus harenae]
MKRKYKWLYAMAAALVIAAVAGYFNRGALAALGFDWLVAGQVEKQLEKTYKPVIGREPMPVSFTAEERDPFSVLLLGVDQRDNEIGRSDTMIYTVVRPSDGNLLMVSIPRDTYTEIVGKDTEDKITHAYAFGGAGMAMDTVENLFDAPIQYYASINFEGFREAIDALGGISLPIEEDIVNKDPNHEKFTIKGGQSSYNGQDALYYVRYREDAGGDISRTERQQTFLNALMDKASGMNQWTKIPELIDIMGNNFETDMRPDQMLDLAQSLLLSKERHIYSHSLTGEGRRLVGGGAWYYFADEEDLSNVKVMIDNWLDADTKAEALLLPEKYRVQQEKEVQSLSSENKEIEEQATRQ